MSDEKIILHNSGQVEIVGGDFPVPPEVSFAVEAPKRTIVYAFDVDDTLEVSNGPVTLASMMELRVQGHIVGLCGNWGVFLERVPGWQHLISFFNYNCSDKVTFLTDMAMRLSATGAHEFVMVGNVGPLCSRAYRIEQTGGSNDFLSSRLAAGDWRFINASDFARGSR